MRTIISIRLRQALRLLTELGWWRLGLLGFYVVLALVGLFTWAVRMQQQPEVPLFTNSWLGLMLILLFFHLTRPDKRFLQLLGVRSRWVYSLEYTAVLFPFLLVGLLAFRPWYSAALATEIGLLAFVTYDLRTNRWYQLLTARITAWFKTGSNRTRLALPIPWLPTEAFEWRSGLRKNWPLVGLLYLAGVVFSGHYGTILVVLFLLSLLTASFYLEGEHRDLLELFAAKHPNVLIAKIRLQLTIFWVMCLPLVLIQVLRHPNNLYLLVYAVTAGSVFQLMGAVLKYAHYRPHADLSRNAWLLALSLPGLAFPHIAAIPVLLILFYYPKARKNIARYLS